jgi:hypothetical protein
LKNVKKGRRKRQRTVTRGDGSIEIVEEEGESESSIDSLMADSPDKY